MNRLMKNVATWTLFCLSLLAGLQVSAVETVVYYHNDILGSPVAATDADCTVSSVSAGSMVKTRYQEIRQTDDC